MNQPYPLGSWRRPQTPERISFSVGCLQAAEARICNNLTVTTLATSASPDM
ncbi:MAG: hypothetical protein GPJ17_15825 [Microcystis aeruginosa K13-07]|nr:hypothetical protein [Microcystis aeruginosa K13-07]